MSLFHREDPCSFLTEKLELFLDGELTGSENLAFETHLKECESCAAYWSDDEEVSTAIMLAVAPDRILASDHLFSPGMPATTPSRTEFDRRHDTERRAGLRVPSRWAQVANWSLAAATLVGISFAAGLLFDRSQSPSDSEGLNRSKSKLVASADIAAVSLRSGDLQVRLAGSDEWGPLGTDESLRDGLEVLAAQGGGELILQVKDAGSLVLGEGSILSLHRVTEDRTQPLDLELLHGSASLHLEERQFEVGLPTGRLEGRDATLVLRAHQLEESVLVLRGQVDLRTDDFSEQLQAGEWRQLRPLPGLDGASTTSADNPVDRLAELESLLSGLRDQLGRTLAANSSLQAELKLLRSSGESQRGTVIDPSTILAAYLHVVDQTNSVRLDRPSPLTVQTATELRGFGAEAVTTLAGVFNSDDGLLRRRAVIALLAEIALPGSRRALERICYDREVKMRGAALFCLSKLPDADLGHHFLSVARTDAVESIKFRAANYAAKRGELEGVTILATLYHETTDKYRRSHIVNSIAALNADQPAATRFLRTVLFDRASDRFSLMTAIRGLVKRNDVESLPGLRELLERTDLSADLRQQAKESIHKLELN